MSTEIELKIKECIMNTIENSEEVLKSADGNTLLIKLGLNSISFIKLIVSIEKEFNIELDDSELDVSKFKTIKDIIDLVEQKVSMN